MEPRSVNTNMFQILFIFKNHSISGKSAPFSVHIYSESSRFHSVGAIGAKKAKKMFFFNRFVKNTRKQCFLSNFDQHIVDEYANNKSFESNDFEFNDKTKRQKKNLCSTGNKSIYHKRPTEQGFH